MSLILTHHILKRICFYTRLNVVQVTLELITIACFGILSFCVAAYKACEMTNPCPAVPSMVLNNSPPALLLPNFCV